MNSTETPKVPTIEMINKRIEKCLKEYNSFRIHSIYRNPSLYALGFFKLNEKINLVVYPEHEVKKEEMKKVLEELGCKALDERMNQFFIEVSETEIDKSEYDALAALVENIEKYSKIPKEPHYPKNA